MLELRPTCENCNAELPPDSLDARICTYECTFCASCVEGVLLNVCPNCGGGFAARPVRPRAELRPRHGLGFHPASEEVRHRPIDPDAHREFASEIAEIPPHLR
ncbi:MAG: DUF1272 domain-containing protein [Solirubrobacterales bacterium]